MESTTFTTLSLNPMPNKEEKEKANDNPMNYSSWNAQAIRSPRLLGSDCPIIQSFDPLPDDFFCSDSAESEKLFYEMMEVENTAVPDGYNPAPVIYKEVDDEVNFEADLPEDNIAYTTLPQKYLNRPDDCQGYTEWIVNGDTKEKVLDIQGFPRPVPQPLGGQPVHVVCESLDTAFGVFVTRDIKVGELIFAERPFLVAPRTLGFVPGSVVEDFTMDIIKQIQWSELEIKLQIAVNRMEDSTKKAFMQLPNSHTDDGSGPISGIFLTNAFELGSLADGPVGIGVTDSNGYAGIARDGSRINHSCMPNTSVVFDVGSFSLQFFAIKDLKPGDELSYAYCNIYAPRTERRKSLGRYGILCVCPACINSSPASESFRRDFILRIKKVQKEVDEWQCKPIKMSGSAAFVPQILEREAVLAKVLTLQKQLIEEGLDASDHYSIIFTVLHKLYIQLGKMRRAERAFQQMLRYEALARLDLE